MPQFLACINNLALWFCPVCDLSMSTLKCLRFSKLDNQSSTQSYLAFCGQSLQRYKGHENSCISYRATPALRNWKMWNQVEHDTWKFRGRTIKLDFTCIWVKMENRLFDSWPRYDWLFDIYLLSFCNEKTNVRKFAKLIWSISLPSQINSRWPQVFSYTFYAFVSHKTIPNE